MKFKNDRYRHLRGGNTKILKIACRQCAEHVCDYQKDGTGGLLRMYRDRITNPQVSLADKGLKCPNGHLLGVKMVYEKEKRQAYRLIPNSIQKTEFKK